MGRLVFPAPGSMKSIQRGVITFSASNASATATISSVDVNKTELRFLGNLLDSTQAAYIVLTNSTTITASRVGNAAQASVSWELTEYW